MIVHPLLAQARFQQGIRALLECPESLEKIGVRFVSYAYPVLIVALEWRAFNRWIRLHVDANDYDYRPLSGWWVDDADKPLLPGHGIVPAGLGFQPSGPPCGSPRSWFCFPGWKDWHDHSGHQDVAWPVHRAEPRFGALALIQQLHSDLNRTGVNPV